MTLRKRWWLLVLDANNTVIHNEAFWTQGQARKAGRAITSPPLNRYEVRKVGERNVTNRKDRDG